MSRILPPHRTLRALWRDSRRAPACGAPAVPLQAALATALLLGGCGFADEPARWTVTVDRTSNGAPHVINQPPETGIEPTWVIEEELRIGALDEAGPSSFGRVKGLAVLDDGRMAVLDAQAQEVRLFAPDGAHLRTFGRKGAGPGELESPWGLMRDEGGRLWVPDHSNDRMTVYDPETGEAASYAMPVLRYGFIWDGAMLRDGRILKPSMTLAPERRDLLRVYSPTMELVDSILDPEYDGPPVDPKDPPGAFYWEAPGGLPRGYIQVPFHARPHSAFDPSGHRWVSDGGSAGYGVARMTLQHDTTLLFEARRPPVPLPPAVRDSAIEEVRSYLQQRGAARQDWSKVPTVRPSVEQLFVAEDGRVWVRTAGADSLVTFDLYDPDGRYAGTAVTPMNVSSSLAPVVRGQEFWAVVTDEFDVQYVVRGRLRPTARSEAP